MSANQTGLGATIRAWRDRLTAADVGLPSGRARRAAGLRREELAELAGVSVDYVMPRECGTSPFPSATHYERQVAPRACHSRSVWRSKAG